MSAFFNYKSTPIAGCMLLEASAGTGKTWALEHMVARLVGREEDPLTLDQVLVVTFTNKAAREIKERIRQIITDRAVNNQTKYVDALASFDKVSIYTIHGFCRMVLSSWPFEAMATFEQEIVSGYDLEIEETRNWLASITADETFDDTNVQAAWTRAGGTEKLIETIVSKLTETTTNTGAVFLPTKKEIDNFLAFSEEAEVKEGRLSICTKRLFGRKWSTDAIKKVFMAVGIRKQINSLEKIQAHMEACSGIQNLSSLEDWTFGDPTGLDIKNHFLDLLCAIHNSGSTEQTVQGEALELQNVCKNFIETINPVIEFSTNDSSKRVSSLIQKFQELAFQHRIENDLKPRIDTRKKSQGRWNFNDLVEQTANAIAVEGSPLKSVLQTRFKAAIIDEFQDTDPLQWQIFKKLFYTPFHILVLIGDPKQSIYGFRGTGLAAYRTAAALVPENQCYLLDTNWRSSSQLVDTINRLFTPVFQSRCGNWSPIGFTPIKAGKTMKSFLKWHGAEKPVSLFPVENESMSSERIVLEIRAILDKHTGASWIMNNGECSPVQPSDIAVLVRSGSQETDVTNRLLDLNIPAIRYRDESIFDQPIISLLISLLEAINEPRNTGLLKGVLSGRFFRLPPDILLQLEEAGYLDNFVEWNVELKGEFNSGHSARALNSFFIRSAEMGSWIEQFIDKVEAKRLKKPWTIRVLSEPEGERLWQDWNHIGEIIQERQTAGIMEVGRIISWLKKTTNGGYKPGGETPNIRRITESSAVMVMTMHSAKGLEFPLVFLHGGYKGKTRRNDSTGFNYRFENDDALFVDRLYRERYFNDHIAHAWEEEKRLWYVAFTRASVKLWVPLSIGNDNKITQLDSLWGLMTSQVDGNAKIPPHESGDTVMVRLRERIFDAITHSFQDVIHCTFPDESGIPDPLPRPILKKGRLSPLPAFCTQSRDPVTSSFTSLVNQTENISFEDDKDRDNLDEDGISADTGMLLPEDSGLNFGQLVHACMELCNINLAVNKDVWFNDGDTDSLFSEQSARYYPPGWYLNRSADLKALIRLGLCAPISELGRICDLSNDCYRREIGFLIHVPNQAHFRLNAITERTMKLSNGFLKGYIDLLACKEGRWWVLDWKTNIPRQEQTWEEVMDFHHYRFQYELYLLAFCRTLSASRNRPVNWKKEIGGAVYVFLRGLNADDPESRQGIIMEKPSFKRMHELAELFGCPDSIIDPET